MNIGIVFFFCILKQTNKLNNKTLKIFMHVVVFLFLGLMSIAKLHNHATKWLQIQNSKLNQQEKPIQIL